LIGREKCPPTIQVNDASADVTAAKLDIGLTLPQQGLAVDEVGAVAVVAGELSYEDAAEGFEGLASGLGTQNFCLLAPTYLGVVSSGNGEGEERGNGFVCVLLCR
jgi:hypothetical protein